MKKKRTITKNPEKYKTLIFINAYIDLNVTKISYI